MADQHLLLPLNFFRNLDPLTETYGLSFYMQYLAHWPEYFQVAEAPGGEIMGYSKGLFNSSYLSLLLSYQIWIKTQVERTDLEKTPKVTTNNIELNIDLIRRFVLRNLK